MNTLQLVLDVAGVVCLGLAAANVSGQRVNIGFLGLTLIGISHLLLPIIH